MSSPTNPCALGPVPNLDVSGIGVRVSAYTQTILLSFLALEGDRTDIADALLNLMLCNAAYVLVTIGLSFEPDPKITLYDALIIAYMVLGSWIPLFLSLIRYTSLRAPGQVEREWKHHFVYPVFVFQTVATLGLTLLLIFSTSTLGSDASCNDYRVISFFWPFKINNATRITCMVILLVVVLGLSIFMVNLKSIATEHLRTSALWRTSLIISLFSVPWIYNVEMLCKYNEPQPGQQSWASVGQLLPMVLMSSTVAKTFRTMETRIRQSWRCLTLSNPARHSPDIELSNPVLSTPNHLTPQEITCASDENLHQSVPSGLERVSFTTFRYDHDCVANDYDSETDLTTINVVDFDLPQPRNRLYYCPRCNKAFPRPSGSKTHMNFHTGAKPFHCGVPGCSKTFAVKSNMTRHMRTHGITSVISSGPIGFPSPPGDHVDPPSNI